jgi:hypothetical protein
MSFHTIFSINGFLLGITFLWFGMVSNQSINVAHVAQNTFRAAIALNVTSFICFLLSTTACACHSWLVDTMEGTPKPVKCVVIFDYVLKSIAIPLLFFLGMITLTAAVACLIQATLGIASDDNLVAVAVAFLALAGVVVLGCIILTGCLLLVAYPYSLPLPQPNLAVTLAGQITDDSSDTVV